MSESQSEYWKTSIARSWATARNRISSASSQAGPWLTEYQGREADFAREKLGEVHPPGHPAEGESTWWRFQFDLVEAVFRNRLVAVAGCRSSSKSHTLRYLIPIFLLTAPSRVIVTATAERQVKVGLLGGAAAAIRRAGFASVVKCNALDLTIDELHYCIGFSAKNPDAARSFHASPIVPSNPDSDCMSAEDIEFWKDLEQQAEAGIRLLLIVDEASGIDPLVYRVLRGMLTKPNVFIVMSGNPFLGVDDDHPFVNAFRRGSGFETFRVSAFDPYEYPNTTDLRYDHEYRVPEWLSSAEEKERALEEYDPNEPLFLSDWLGLFSPGSVEAQVVPRSAIVVSRGKHFTNPDRQEIGPRIGVDIGFSHDPCVATLMLNGVVMSIKAWLPPSDAPDEQNVVADDIRELCIEWGWMLGQAYPHLWHGAPVWGSRRLSIDDSGLVGVGSILARDGVMCDRVRFGDPPIGNYRALMNGQQFLNQRAEMYWTARRGLQTGLFHIPDLPMFRTLWEQLPWTRYTAEWKDGAPQIVLEPKKDIIERHGQSPDYADSFVLACRGVSMAMIETDGPPAAPLLIQRGALGGLPMKPRNRKKPRRGTPGWSRVSISGGDSRWQSKPHGFGSNPWK